LFHLKNNISTRNSQGLNATSRYIETNIFEFQPSITPKPKEKEDFER